MSGPIAALEENGDAPRRSVRERKKPEYMVQQAKPTAKKRTRAEVEEEEDEEDEDDDDDDDEDEDDEEEEEESAPQPKRRKTASGAAAKPTKGKAGAGKGKAAAKANGAAAGGKKGKGKGRGKAAEVESLAGGEIKDDNPIFNHVVSPNASSDLKAFVEDWVVNFSETGGPADGQEGLMVAEMITFLFRCCGLNYDVDREEADDWNGVDDRMEDLHEQLTNNKEAAPAHPLVSKDKQFKPFRANLDLFLTLLVTNLSETSLLYLTNTSPQPTNGPRTPLIQLMLHWLAPMTVSPYRGIRHTAAYVALSMCVALSQIASEVTATYDQTNRQIESDKKKAAGRGKLTAAQTKKNAEGMAALKNTARELSEKKAVLESYLKETFDGVFVHRARDADTAIRADCMKMLGTLLLKFPERWVNSTYLSYLDWALTDSENTVRIEAVKALQPIYSKNPRISAIRTFTGRVSSRLMEMAVRDINLNIRIQAIHILSLIDKTGLLSDEEGTKRNHIACLIYDKEPRVRKAAAAFVANLWKEKVEELVVEEEEAHGESGLANGHGAHGSSSAAGDDNDSELSDVEDEDNPKHRKQSSEARYPGWKALASCLMSYTRLLENQFQEVDEEDEAQGVSQAALQRQQNERDLMASLSHVSQSNENHASVAVDALWGEMDTVQEWRSLVDLLVVDHSKESIREHSWSLTEAEESFLLDVLFAVLKKAQEVPKGKEANREALVNEVSRVLINSINALLAKSLSDTGRLIEVLRIIAGIRHDLYSELSMKNAFETLWSEITKQFINQTDPLVFRECVAAFRTFLKASSLRTENANKVAQLKTEVANSLRQALSGRDVAEVVFGEDDVLEVEASLARIAGLFSFIDLRDIMEGGDEDEAGIWDIVLALASKGTSGAAHEVKMVQHALTILQMYLNWTLVSAVKTGDAAPTADVIAKRDDVLNLLADFATGEAAGCHEAVKNKAFHQLLKLYTSFRKSSGIPKDLAVEMSDAIQYKLAGQVEEVVGRYVDAQEEDRAAEEDEEEDEDDEDEAERVTKRRKLNSGKKAEKDLLKPDLVRSDAEFTDFIWAYTGAMRVGAIEAQHAGTVLKFYGLAGPSYDAAMEFVVGVLREEGQYNKEGILVSETVGLALREAFERHLDVGDLTAEPHCYQLAKAVQPAFFGNKANFKTESRIDAAAAIDFHESGINWIVPKLAHFLKQEKAAKEKKSATATRFKQKAVASLQFFRMLSLLIPALGAKGALKVRKYLADTLAQHEVKTGELKVFEPIHQYEKRLVSSISSDKHIKAAASRQKPVVVVEEEDEGEVPEIAQVEEPAPAAPAPRQAPAAAVNGGAAAAGPSNGSNGHARPKPRPRLAKRPGAAQAEPAPESPRAPSPEPEQEREPEPEPEQLGEDGEELEEEEPQPEWDDELPADDDMGLGGGADGFDMGGDEDDLELPDPDAADQAALAADDEDRLSRASGSSYNQVRPRKKIRRL